MLVPSIEAIVACSVCLLSRKFPERCVSQKRLHCATTNPLGSNTFPFRIFRGLMRASDNQIFTPYQLVFIKVFWDACFHDSPDAFSMGVTTSADEQLERHYWWITMRPNFEMVQHLAIGSSSLIDSLYSLFCLRNAVHKSRMEFTLTFSTRFVRMIASRYIVQNFHAGLCLAESFSLVITNWGWLTAGLKHRNVITFAETVRGQAQFCKHP